MLSWHRIPLLAVLALSLGLVALPHAQAAKKKDMPEPEPFGHFTVEQVSRRIGQPGVYIFDGNRPETYAQKYVPGAVRLYHDDVTAATLPQDKSASLIFYCANEL
jgi:rhodanese-like protein